MNRFIMLMLLALCNTAIFAQTNESSKTKKEQTAKAKFCCPSHPEVADTKPGKCAKCGTKLIVQRRGSKQAEEGAYSCPMHPDVVSDRVGKCSKCGMELEEKKGEKSKS